MGRRYATELLELPESYRQISQLPASAFELAARAQECIEQMSVEFVGSGGTLALAELAASLQQRRTGRLASAVTPLQLAGKSFETFARDTASVLFSARARHPDVRIAAQAARRRGDRLVILVTQLQPTDVDPRLRESVDQIVTLPQTTADGFLATNSLLAMSTAWLVAGGEDLPVELPALEPASTIDCDLDGRFVIAYGPAQKPAAVDLEARFSESGLADVQLADYRNLAHGRHVGLLAKAATTSIIAMVGPESAELADRTIRVLPAKVKLAELRTALAEPAGTLDTLAAGMRLFGALALRASVDPGQPRVGTVGRRLYHLPWARSTLRTEEGMRPATLKAAVAGCAPRDGAGQAAWRENYRRWVEAANGRHVLGVLLDYDGTCCETNARFELPTVDVREQIIALMDRGVLLGFASGRGPSLPADLREWLPQSYWGRVTVGLYNGGLIQPLTGDFPREKGCDGSLAAAAEMMEELLSSDITFERRPWQVTLESKRRDRGLGLAVDALLARHPGLPVRAVSSGHSVDLVPSTTNKVAVALAMGVAMTNLLLVGDQGQVGGNDLELLASGTLSLSVDRVSGDPERCWNLADRPGVSGPKLLVKYLDAVVRTKQGDQFRWRLRK